MKKITSKDVAAAAGVSQSAVSLILNHNPRISFSEETRQRVFDAAAALGYRVPSRRGAGEKASERKILVLVPTLTNHYYSELIQYLQGYAGQYQYRLLVCNTFRNPELERYYLDTFLSQHLDGIIYTFLPGFPEIVEQISQHTPTVLIGEKKGHDRYLLH